VGPEIHRYPDGGATRLRQALAERWDLGAANIVCGNGSDDVLQLLAHAYCGEGDEVLYRQHGFLVYPIAAKACGATPVTAPETDLTTSVDALLSRVTDKTRIVFVANPNNPTGTLMSRTEVARLHAALPGDTLLVLDQAYAEYLAPDDDDGGLNLAAMHENVLVTRTLSKIYGLAGERIGWATGARALIATLNRIRGPFNVTNSGQAMALAAIADQDFVARSREHNAVERARFTAEIEALGNHGLRVVPSAANFVLVLFEGALDAETAYHGLAERGTIVRWLPGQGLAQALRITIGTRAQMEEVTAALREMAQAAR
jgi:histidinol-phosphate aminotransferase